MIIVFTLINPFICFFLTKLNNFAGFITSVVKKWLIRMRSLVAAPALLVLTYLMVDRRTPNRGVEEITSWLTSNHFYHQEKQGILLQIKLYPSNKRKKKGRLDYITQQYICIWAYVCKTSL